ncbi:Starch-binding associating with outer membrane [bacterium A37T11]|nr:Starch-binding associating with outer membrane [bacterium A37T11]
MKKNLLAIALIGLMTGCSYLDVVPDNVATVDYAFRLRSQAEKYLFTCYSYLPSDASWNANPALLSGDEIWFFYPTTEAFYGTPPSNWEVARGNQNVVNPYLDYMSGTNGGKPLFQAIRDCNTFLANIGKVPDMQEEEKTRWISEVTFLKAYYHWFLVRMYGPMPIIDENLPISAGVGEVDIYRQPVDSCFNFITRLIDKSLPGLPDQIEDRISELGRIDKSIALALKARILTTFASPLFNGNTEYSNFKDNRGVVLFNTVADPSRWQYAADACKQAIDFSLSQGHELYHFNPLVNTYKIGPEIKLQMDLRNAICDKWNAELIWGASNSMVGSLQQYAQPYTDPSVSITNGATRPYGEYAPTMKIAELFYTKNGVPIEEDKTWDYGGRYGLKVANDANKLFIQSGYTTAALNFDREPRFYADMGFDGGIWYGQGKYDESSTWHVEGKSGQYSGVRGGGEYSITGYYVKKLVNFLNVLQTNGMYAIQSYPWPIIRLADLYLYYAEALNEAGSKAEALEWINKVRDRAGLPTVEQSWTQFAKHPTDYQSKEGLRKIIHQERLIEMAFEGGRYWDLVRWKEATSVMSGPVLGWDVKQTEAAYYYKPLVLFGKTFKSRDYLWPVKEQNTIVNNNLVQNPGW